MEKKISIYAVGDLILDEPGPMEPYFDLCREELLRADVMIGHVEVPHTERYLPSCIDIQAPPSKPEHLEVLSGLGFDIATVGGNHLYDCGPYGVVDTVEKLKQIGIQTAGGGATLYEARKPAIVEREGMRIGVLSFNAAGPKLGWATSIKPGTSYIDVETSYQPVMDMPHSPCRIYSYMTTEGERVLKEEVAKYKKECDILIVAFHKGQAGKGPNPGWLCSYEVPMTHAAVDAGADIVIGHHHHMLKGIEFYKEKPIFHGLGNFVTVTYAMTPGYNETDEMKAYMERRVKEGRGQAKYDPPYYPWGPETRLTMIAGFTVGKDGKVEAGFIPCKINDKGGVQVYGRDDGGQEILEFVEKLTKDMGFETGFCWDDEGERVVVRDLLKSLRVLK